MSEAAREAVATAAAGQGRAPEIQLNLPEGALALVRFQPAFDPGRPGRRWWRLVPRGGGPYERRRAERPCGIAQKMEAVGQPDRRHRPMTSTIS